MICFVKRTAWPNTHRLLLLPVGNKTVPGFLRVFLQQQYDQTTRLLLPIQSQWRSLFDWQEPFKWHQQKTKKKREINGPFFLISCIIWFKIFKLFVRVYTSISFTIDLWWTSFMIEISRLICVTVEKERKKRWTKLQVKNKFHLYSFLLKAYNCRQNEE